MLQSVAVFRGLFVRCRLLRRALSSRRRRLLCLSFTYPWNAAFFGRHSASAASYASVHSVGRVLHGLSVCGRIGLAAVRTRIGRNRGADFVGAYKVDCIWNAAGYSNIQVTSYKLYGTAPSAELRR